MIELLQKVKTNLLGNDGYEPIRGIDDDEFGTLDSDHHEITPQISIGKNTWGVRRLLVATAMFIIWVVIFTFILNSLSNFFGSHPNLETSVLPAPAANVDERLVREELENTASVSDQVVGDVESEMNSEDDEIKHRSLLQNQKKKRSIGNRAIIEQIIKRFTQE